MIVSRLVLIASYMKNLKQYLHKIKITINDLMDHFLSRLCLVKQKIRLQWSKEHEKRNGVILKAMTPKCQMWPLTHMVCFYQLGHFGDTTVLYSTSSFLKIWRIHIKTPEFPILTNTLLNDRHALGVKRGLRWCQSEACSHNISITHTHTHRKLHITVVYVITPVTLWHHWLCQVSIVLNNVK